MKIAENIFKSYDIRGIYPDELNEENIVEIIKAIYVFFLKDFSENRPFKFVLGRDMRVSSPSLFEIAKNTLVNLGAEVIDAGLVSTPTFYFTVFHYGYDGGVQISASHNPKEYNGLKIVRNSPRGLIKIGKSTGMEEIKRMSMEGVKVPVTEKGRIIKKEDILKEEVKFALKYTGEPDIKEYKVVADTANAMGSTYIEELFKNIPGKLIKMNFELDGTFPSHQPDPLQFENLKDLQKKVIDEKADLGLAPDGDGDRLFFIDEKGQIVQPSIITALIAKELLKENPGEKVLFDIRYILTPKKHVEERGGKAVITKVGHAFITEQMHQTGGIFAGESSAHYFFKATGNAEAQLPVILFVLKVMSREDKKLSEIVEDLKYSHESGEINFQVNNAEEIMEILGNHYPGGEKITLDGLAVHFPTWRFSVRSSNTEPLMRLNIEELEVEEGKNMKEEIIEIIEKHKK